MTRNTLKLLSVVLALVLVCTMLVACGKKNEDATDTTGAAGTGETQAADPTEGNTEETKPGNTDTGNTGNTGNTDTGSSEGGNTQTTEPTETTGPAIDVDTSTEPATGSNVIDFDDLINRGQG